MIFEIAVSIFGEAKLVKFDAWATVLEIWPVEASQREYFDVSACILRADASIDPGGLSMATP